MQKFVLLVAGGSGTRMKLDTPKQFVLINNKPLLMHTFEAFLRYDKNLHFVLVLPGEQLEFWKELCHKYNFTTPCELTSGGKNRFQSVKNGLELVPPERIVFIHDGVRPLVSRQTLKNCYHTTVKHGNALPIIPVSESVRYVDGNNNHNLNRSKYFLVQTPQTFHSTEIKEAYRTAGSENFTDDASVLEHSGKKIWTVDGNRENIKVTYPADIQTASVLLDNNLVR